MKLLLSFGLIPVYQEGDVGEFPEKQSDQGLFSGNSDYNTQ